MKFQVILPMAGKGTRVRELDQDKPKPLLNVGGVPLYRHALSFFKDNDLVDRVIPIIRSEDLEFFTSGLEKSELENLIVLESETRGALETVSFASTALADDLPVVCLDSDLKFSCNELFELNDLSDYAGALFTFKSNKPTYSYVKAEAGIALDIAEKVVISNHAICGAYLISRGDIFKKYVKEILSDSSSHMQKGELYLSSLFKKMIQESKKIKVFTCDSQISMGTSEEITKARAFAKENPDAF